MAQRQSPDAIRLLRSQRKTAASRALLVMAASAGNQPKRWGPPEVGPEPRQLARSDAPGSRDRDYWVYAPRRSPARRLLDRPAVILLLHGCDQSAEALIRSTRFIELAETRDCVVVFPHVTSWSSMPWRARDCWGFWIEAERRRDEGELGDLRRILDQVEREFDTDPRRRYVAGLSSGGAMAVAMAVAYPDVVRAAGAVAGLAYGETSAAVSSRESFRALAPWFSAFAAACPGPQMRSLAALVQDMEAGGTACGEDRTVPLLVIQSTHDQVVQIENARMLRDVWLARHGAVEGHLVQCERLAGAAGERCSYFDTDGRMLIETVFYEGRRDAPTHYWPGDSDDPPYADTTGPSATDALLNFFEREGL
jgi:poly(hydroxyalkanoate) depolymerase family esterase